MTNAKKDDDERPERRPRAEGDSLQERDARYVRVLHETRDPRAATRAYVAGNRWATENARGVGNL